MASGVGSSEVLEQRLKGATKNIVKIVAKDAKDPYMNIWIESGAFFVKVPKNYEDYKKEQAYIESVIEAYKLITKYLAKNHQDAYSRFLLHLEEEHPQICAQIGQGPPKLESPIDKEKKMKNYIKNWKR